MILNITHGIHASVARIVCHSGTAVENVLALQQTRNPNWQSRMHALQKEALLTRLVQTVGAYSLIRAAQDDSVRDIWTQVLP